MTFLRHYSQKPIPEVLDRPQVEEESEYWKPTGLWLSVEGVDDWSWVDWCESECFSFPRQAPYIYDVDVYEDSVLWLRGAGDLDAFHRLYGRAFRTRFGTGRWHIRWDRVALDWGGIIIAPYVAERRLEYSWYYGWDCSSGCIWSASAVRSLNRVVTRPEARSATP